MGMLISDGIVVRACPSCLASNMRASYWKEHGRCCRLCSAMCCIHLSGTFRGEMTCLPCEEAALLKMAPGSSVYSPSEYARLQAQLAGAAEASEVFDEDELERYAAEQRSKETK